MSRKLTFRQLRAIVAMLQEPSLEQAAKRVGIHVKTLKLWRRKPAFQKLYHEQAERIFDAEMNYLMLGLRRAFETLVACLDAEKARDRISAADSIMRYAMRAHEIQVLLREFGKLENLKTAVNQIFADKNSPDLHGTPFIDSNEDVSGLAI